MSGAAQGAADVYVGLDLDCGHRLPLVLTPPPELAVALKELEVRGMSPAQGDRVATASL